MPFVVQFVGNTGKLEKPGDYFTGRMGDVNYVVVKVIP